MKSHFAFACLVLLCTATGALAAEDSANWKTYRNPRGDFELKYPDTLTLRENSGTICINKLCRPDEGFVLVGNEARPVRYVFNVQRQVVQNQRSLAQFFEAQLGRPLNPALEKSSAFAGRPAIRRKGMFPVVSASFQDGKMVKSTQSPRQIDLLDIQINPTDLLSVSNQSPEKLNDETYEKILSTLWFAR